MFVVIKISLKWLQCSKSHLVKVGGTYVCLILTNILSTIYDFVYLLSSIHDFVYIHVHAGQMFCCHFKIFNSLTLLIRIIFNIKSVIYHVIPHATKKQKACEGVGSCDVNV